MTRLLGSVALVVIALSLFSPVTAKNAPGDLSFVCPAGFPTSVFSSYYVPPSATQEPQPMVFDPALNSTYPLNLTNPTAIPTTLSDSAYFPPALANLTSASQHVFLSTALAEIRQIISGDSRISGNCSKCLAALGVGKLAAQFAPTLVPSAMVALCEATGFAPNSSCTSTYAANVYGDIWTQVLSLADVSGQDGLYICNSLSPRFCATPAANTLNTTGLFPRPKPTNATAPAANGKSINVLHLSDAHLDPRVCSNYSIGGYRE